MITGLLSLFLLLLFVLIPLGLVGGVIFLIVRVLKKGQQRMRDFQNFAAQSGWQYVGDAPFANLPDTQPFYLFSLGGQGLSDSRASRKRQYKRIQNMMYGNIHGFQVSVFDYAYQYGDQEKQYRQTVVMLESPALNLPFFTLRPEGRWQEVGQFFGGQDLDFAAYPNFSKKYLLRGADENHIRYVFNPHALSFLETTTDFCVEGSGNRLFAYRQQVLVKPAEFQTVIQEALQTANLLASSNSMKVGG